MILMTLVLVGCTSAMINQQKSISAGQIGCSPEDIRIVDKPSMMKAHWTAECRGRKFICSQQSASTEGSSASYSCKEELK